MRSAPPRLRPAPRPVPLSLWLRVLNGAAFAQIGWVLLGFTMLFVWVFGGNALVRDLYFFSGPLDYTEGEITRVEETNLTINDERVYAYHYRYSASGERFEGQMIDDLPGHPEIGHDGLFRGDPARATATLLLPAVTLGTHGAWLLHLLEVL